MAGAELSMAMSVEACETEMCESDTRRTYVHNIDIHVYSLFSYIWRLLYHARGARDLGLP